MTNQFHFYLHKQILVLLALSLGPGLGYIFLGWLNHLLVPALIWYGVVLISSIWGFRLYRTYDFDTMSRQALEQWYQQLTYFYYSSFLLWGIIFLIYCAETESGLHYIAIFTQLGASVVASVLLFSDKKLYIPILMMLMLPLSIYFMAIQTWYGIVLSLFNLVFLGVLIYAGNSSNKLLLKTHYQASHDTLTDLYNRSHLLEVLQQSINSLHSTGQFSYLILIDLDHFKTVNDSLGHDIGDALLISVARRMQQQAGKNHTLARLGGDEFIIIGPEFSDKENCQQQAMQFSDYLLDLIKAEYIIDQHHIYISASIGIDIISNKNSKASSFMKEADIAMYEVKASGRNDSILFNKQLSDTVERHLEIERQLHFALEKKEIILNFQPQIGTNDTIVGCEVLARWHNKELGIISPAEFIAIAEKTGFIIELGSYILKEAFKTLSQWQKEGIDLQHFAINISVRQILHHSFTGNIERLCKKYSDSGLCSKIVLELTESIVAEDIKRLVSIMNNLKKTGLRFSMDDFGTGYSSLSYLSELPIDELKIDQSFVSHLDDNTNTQSNNRAMIETIISLGNTFNLITVAEGVETAAQVDFLRHKHCDVLQGYYYSKPVSELEFQQFYTFWQKKQTQ